jgi:hypothetical protein
MNNSRVAVSGSSVFRWLCIALIAVHIVRLVLIVPDWVSVTTAANQSRYMHRLVSGSGSVANLSVVLIALSGAPYAWRKTLAAWGLFAIALALFVADIVIN